MHIDIDGYNIIYKITGSGSKTVVILQGWGTNYTVYDSIANTIAENKEYRVIQFDFPGFGGSDEPREAWNIDSFTDFFCSLMRALKIKQTTLIGHSFGGRVIIKLASRESIPFEISDIILIDSAGILPERTFIQKFNIKKYKVLKKIFANRIIYALFPEVVDDWKSRQGSADYKKASPRMRQCLVLAVNEDLTSLLPNIKQETLLIWGENDTATPVSDAKKMNAQIPHSGLVILQEAGHFSFLEQPIQFKAIIQSYFKTGVTR